MAAMVVTCGLVEAGRGRVIRCVCNARLAEGGWGVSGSLGHWQSRAAQGQRQKASARYLGTLDSSAALLIGATFYRVCTGGLAAFTVFIRYIKHFASCSAATGTNNAHARPNVTCSSRRPLPWRWSARTLSCSAGHNL